MLRGTPSTDHGYRQSAKGKLHVGPHYYAGSALRSWYYRNVDLMTFLSEQKGLVRKWNS